MTRPTGAAYERDVASAIAALPPAYLRCRANRHPWEPRTARAVKDPSHRGRTVFERTLHCPSCGSIRTQTIVTRGLGAEVVYDRVQRPVDYAVKGLGSLNNTSARGVVLLAELLAHVERE